MRPITGEYIQAWVDRGDRDLATARAMRRTGFPDACAVYCQQSVEKLLKAYFMVRLRRHPSKTHKIVELATELALPPQIVEELHDLEADYIQARYPDSFFDGADAGYDDDVAEERIRAAEGVLAWLKERIAEESSDAD